MSSAGPLRPHPRLERYYASDNARPAFVADMFDEGAPYYEWVCRVMSLGTGEQYRKRALRAVGLGEGMRILDVATGTGLVLRSAVELSGGRGLAIGLDPSAGMLGSVVADVERHSYRAAANGCRFRTATLTLSAWVMAFGTSPTCTHCSPSTAGYSNQAVECCCSKSLSRNRPSAEGLTS